MEKPRILTSEILFSGYFNVRQDLIEHAGGRKTSYSQCVLPGDAAITVAETREGRYVLNFEYRHPIGQYIICCPGGSLHPEEDPLIGGMREFHEETGYWSDEVELLGTIYPLPAICNQKISFLSAKNAYPKGPQKLDSFEYIQTRLLTEGELEELIRSGTILDGLLLAGLQLFRSCQ